MGYLGGISFEATEDQVSDPNNGAFVGIDAGHGPFGFFYEIDAVSANGDYSGPIDEGHWAVTSAPVTSTDAPRTHCFCPFLPSRPQDSCWPSSLSGDRGNMRKPAHVFQRANGAERPALNRKAELADHHKGDHNVSGAN
jgi:hypothetical protein